MSICGLKNSPSHNQQSSAVVKSSYFPVRSKNRNALESLSYPLPEWISEARRVISMTVQVGGRGAIMDWARVLAYVTGTVDQELLARNEYLAAENRILKVQLNGRLKLSDSERATLCEIGHRLGRTALAEVATVAKPDTILAWYRKLVAHKFDGSRARRGPGRPGVTHKVEQLIVRLADENRDWGYDRIAGALANLGYRVCDQTVGNVLQRHGLPPAPERRRTTTWSAFIRTHLTLSRDQTHGNCSSSGIQARINCSTIPRITYNPLSPTGC
jgi:hypothetical protein